MKLIVGVRARIVGVNNMKLEICVINNLNDFFYALPSLAIRLNLLCTGLMNLNLMEELYSVENNSTGDLLREIIWGGIS